MKARITKVALLALVAALAVAATPQRRRYDQNSWFVETQPITKSPEVAWERIFPMEGEGSAKMLHIPDSFSHRDARVEIVQGDEVERFEIRKQVATNRKKVTDYTEYLFDLHMLGVDMCLDEKYKSKTGGFEMDGYGVETIQLLDGTFTATITLYTRKPPPPKSTEK